MREHLRRKGRGAARRLARRIEASDGMISNYAAGRRKPVTLYRVRIKRVTGIALDAWDKPLACPARAPIGTRRGA